MFPLTSRGYSFSRFVSYVQEQSRSDDVGRKTSGPDKPVPIFSCVSSSTDSTEKKLFDFSSIFGGIWTFSKANRRTISHGRLGDFGGRKSCQSARSVSPLVPF